MEVELECIVQSLKGIDDIYITIQGNKLGVEKVIEIIEQADKIRIDKRNIRPDNLGKEICPKCNLAVDKRWLKDFYKETFYEESEYKCPKCGYLYHK